MAGAYVTMVMTVLLVIVKKTCFLCIITNFMQNRSFKFSEPAPHLRPVRLKSVESLIDSDMSGGNLFIYSPLQQRNKSKTKSGQ